MDPKAVAAISGVMYYLKSLEDRQPASIAQPETTGLSPWALHGRQSIMRMREMVQRRMVRR